MFPSYVNGGKFSHLQIFANLDLFIRITKELFFSYIHCYKNIVYRVLVSINPGRSLCTVCSNELFDFCIEKTFQLENC